eukprot:2920587-Amphidinium_carterae.1
MANKTPSCNIKRRVARIEPHLVHQYPGVSGSLWPIPSRHSQLQGCKVRSTANTKSYASSSRKDAGNKHIRIHDMTGKARKHLPPGMDRTGHQW